MIIYCLSFFKSDPGTWWSCEYFLGGFSSPEKRQTATRKHVELHANCKPIDCKPLDCIYIQDEQF